MLLVIIKCIFMSIKSVIGKTVSLTELIYEKQVPKAAISKI